MNYKTKVHNAPSAHELNEISFNEPAFQLASQPETISNTNIDECLKLFEFIHALDNDCTVQTSGFSNSTQESQSNKLTLNKRTKKQKTIAFPGGSQNHQSIEDTKTSQQIETASLENCKALEIGGDGGLVKNRTKVLRRVQASSLTPSDQGPSEEGEFEQPQGPMSNEYKSRKNNRRESSKKRFYSLRELLDHLHSEQGSRNKQLVDDYATNNTSKVELETQEELSQSGQLEFKEISTTQIKIKSAKKSRDTAYATISGTTPADCVVCS